jgi:hypothetical protein
MSRPFGKLTLDLDGVEAAPPTTARFQIQRMTNGKSRLLITRPPDKPGVFRALAKQLAEPFFVLYVLHTPRGEGAAGRYQSPPLDHRQLDDFLASFTDYLAGDARHNIWVYSTTDGRTLIWDRHDVIYTEGEPIDDIVLTLEAIGFVRGSVPRLGASPHIHHYREEFDDDASAVLAHFDWTCTERRPQDEQ